MTYSSNKILPEQNCVLCQDGCKENIPSTFLKRYTQKHRKSDGIWIVKMAVKDVHLLSYPKPIGTRCHKPHFWPASNLPLEWPPGGLWRPPGDLWMT